jgi:hypothetical protein
MKTFKEIVEEIQEKNKNADYVKIISIDGYKKKFVFIGDFCEGKAHFQYYNKNKGIEKSYNYGLFGYLNEDGSVFIKPKFSSAIEFRDGMAEVRYKGQNYLLHKNKKLELTAQD